MANNHVSIIAPSSFEQINHYYPKVLHAQIHPLIAYFFRMSQETLIQRYCHLHPLVKKKKLKGLLNYQPKHMRWAGADLFTVTTETGIRKMVLLETNSSPSGQKSMPLLADHKEMGGYRFLIENSFCPLLHADLPKGDLAVLYDKNHMEASGYAYAMAEILQENVFLVPAYDQGTNIRFTQGVLEINSEDQWHPIRAAFRYVTQKPWNRIPVHTKTLMYNPTLACLAGGRNKSVAAKAYDMYNAELQNTGLEIITPETVSDVSKEEIPLWIERFGGRAVIKIPYSNAGQGVYTITSERELKKFMSKEHPYKQFIIQSLIGNAHWSSHTKSGKLYHIGTMPNKKQEVFVADLRMMLVATPAGFRPAAIYSRRAQSHLVDTLKPNTKSWEILGTNLSIKLGPNDWDSQTDRLLMMDQRDFNRLGMGIDDLIESKIQTVLAIIAIDKMAKRLLTKKGEFRMKLFSSLNNDPQLLSEIILH